MQKRTVLANLRHDATDAGSVVTLNHSIFPSLVNIKIAERELL